MKIKNLKGREIKALLIGLAFLAAGLTDMNREFLWLLVPILLFHELGHYVAMRVFGYRTAQLVSGRRGVPLLGSGPGEATASLLASLSI